MNKRGDKWAETMQCDGCIEEPSCFRFEWPLGKTQGRPSCYKTDASGGDAIHRSQQCAVLVATALQEAVKPYREALEKACKILERFTGCPADKDLQEYCLGDGCKSDPVTCWMWFLMGESEAQTGMEEPESVPAEQGPIEALCEGRTMAGMCSHPLNTQRGDVIQCIDCRNIPF